MSRRAGAVTTAPDVFVPVRDEWRDWLNRVDADIKQREPTSVLRKPENLVDWLRALQSINARVDSQIAVSKRYLADAKPLVGPMDRSYLAAKRRVDLVMAPRLRFLLAVKERIAECKHLLSQASINQGRSVAELINALVRAAELIHDGNHQGAEDLIDNILDRLEVEK